MAGNLFVKAKNQESLESFVKRMEPLLNLHGARRRESSNYINGEYSAATALSVGVTFAWSDDADPDLEEYSFWIQLEPSGVWVEDRGFLDGLGDLLARRLTVGGDSVVRVPNVGRNGGAKVFYSLREGAPSASREQVITTVK